MSYVHGSKLVRSMYLSEKRIDRLVLNTTKEVLEYWKRLINVRSKLDFTGSTFLHENLTRPKQILEMQVIEMLLFKQAVFFLYQGLAITKVSTISVLTLLIFFFLVAES